MASDWCGRRGNRWPQSRAWSRQRQVNALRSALREYYPAALAAFGTGLAASDAVAVLSIAPTPEAGRALSRATIAAAVRRAGRQRNTEQRASEIAAALRADYLHAPPATTGAYGAAARSAIRLIAAFTGEITELEDALSGHFEQHPDAKIVRSLPELGTVLGARVLGEFGDDRTRFTSPQSRKNYADTSPVTRASGRSLTVLARHARNRRLADALEQWAFCSLTQSPGAHAYYDQLRGRGKTHRQRHANSPTAGPASSTSASTAASSTTKTPPGTTGKPPPLDTFQPWDG